VICLQALSRVLELPDSRLLSIRNGKVGYATPEQRKHETKC
jgi:hypothetical protein